MSSSAVLLLLSVPVTFYLLYSYTCNYYSRYSTPVRRVRGIVIILSVCVCLSVCLCASMSLELLDRSSRNFVCRSPAAVAWSSSGGFAIRYVLPVLWMTSRDGVAIPGRFQMLCLLMFFIN